jgi:hypothetical protein
MKRSVPVFLFLCCASQPILADHASPSFETGAAGAIMTTPGATLSQGESVFGSSIQYLDLEEIPDVRLEELGAADEDVHSVNSLLQFNVSLAYGITDDLTIGANLPYVERHDIREAHHDMGMGEVELAGDAKGLGDLTLFTQYRFLRNDAQDIALLAGVKMPTGSTDERELEGGLFEIEQQPGSGSWDPFIGLAANHNIGRLGFSVNVLYTLVTEGDQQTDLGDLFNYNLAASYRAYSPEGGHAHDPHQHALDLIDYVDFSLELNGSERERLTISGVEEENSGGHILLLSPGVRVGLGHRWSFYTSVGIPLVNDLNGVQSETELRVIGGFSLVF